MTQVEIHKTQRSTSYKLGIDPWGLLKQKLGQLWLNPKIIPVFVCLANLVYLFSRRISWVQKRNLWPRQTCYYVTLYLQLFFHLEGKQNKLFFFFFRNLRKVYPQLHKSHIVPCCCLLPADQYNHTESEYETEI